VILVTCVVVNETVQLLEMFVTLTSLGDERSLLHVGLVRGFVAVAAEIAAGG